MLRHGDPYHMAAGEDLDRLVHSIVIRSSEPCPAYSTEPNPAELVLAKLKGTTRGRVVLGRTGSRNQKWFARYESDPSDGTEVWADTAPLAICRLAVLHAIKHPNA